MQNTRTTAVDVMTSYISAMRAGRWEEGFAHFAPGIVGHVPGTSPVAGVKNGKAEVVGYLRAALARAPGEVRVDLLDMLAGEEHVALFVRERFGGPSPFELLRLNLYRVREGLIDEIRIFEADQATADAHFG
ncbi:nuclear transport factor 2 family protein [Kineococcus indalonis]|uniref:nuclear transport factor 2 family protein n=1 Tax=Kineococcus indalonis TaxID=2696566 RepID=UPI001412793D|nr:nuclear transport factor 2 family protein [Kineococcus indalonis]NAZ88156.1 hypothetical protein [Kineococcus indalonis]